MALTEQEKKQTLQDFGFNSTTIGSSDLKASKVNKIKEIQKDYKTTGFFADLKGIGTDIASSATRRKQNVANIQQAEQAGEQGLLRSTFQKLGQGAGLVSDVIGATVMGGVKAITPQGIQEKTGEVVEAGVEKIAETDTAKKLMSWYEGLDEKTQRDLSATGGFAQLLTDVAGGVATKKGTDILTSAVKRGSDASQEAFDRIKSIKLQAGDVAGDILPTRQGVLNTEITKALDLTQGDVNKIYQSTGNQTGDFISQRNLIGNNLDETITNLNNHFDTNFKQVRDEISQVPNIYKQTAVPRYKQALTEIQKVVQDVAGLEDVNTELRTLLTKTDLSLSDVQRAKELMDEHLKLYNVLGDVGSGASKEGLAKIRNELKTFIEKEVKKNTGTDIKALNNEVATAKTILNAIDTRITRGTTRATITAGDVITFLTGSGFGSPVGGVLAVLAKKLYQSPSFKLRLTKWLNKKTPEQRVKIFEELQEGKVPAGIKVLEKKD